LTLPNLRGYSKELWVDPLAIPLGSFLGLFSHNSTLQGLPVTGSITVTEVSRLPGFHWMTVAKLAAAFCIPWTASYVVKFF